MAGGREARAEAVLTRPGGVGGDPGPGDALADLLLERGPGRGREGDQLRVCNRHGADGARTGGRAVLPRAGVAHKLAGGEDRELRGGGGSRGGGAAGDTARLRGA